MRDSALPWTPQTLLEALPDATALLDDNGVVVAVNRAWERLLTGDGGVPAGTGAGTSYLDLCRGAAATGSVEAAAALHALEEVLSGASVEHDLDYRDTSEEATRWFTLRATRIAGPPPGVMVAHQNITRRKRAEQALARQVTQDPLTGLSNRTALMRALARALVHASPERRAGAGVGVGVLYLDVDGLKPINDNFGHAAGDELLQSMAKRLLGSVREGDTVARLGGDEFAVVAPHIGADELLEIRDRILQSLAEPSNIQGHWLPLSASIGMEMAGRGELPAAVLARADAAMYAQKWIRTSEAAETSKPPSA